MFLGLPKVVLTVPTFFRLPLTSSERIFLRNEDEESALLDSVKFSNVNSVLGQFTLTFGLPRLGGVLTFGWVT